MGAVCVLRILGATFAQVVVISIGEGGHDDGTDKQFHVVGQKIFPMLAQLEPEPNEQHRPGNGADHGITDEGFKRIARYAGGQRNKCTYAR